MVKNIIPAIASTNAIIAGVTAQEVLKLATQFSKGLNNFMMYVGSESVYSHCVEYKRDAECIICSPGLGLDVDPRHTLQEVNYIVQTTKGHHAPLLNESLAFSMVLSF